jgi:Rha family phage regulatory protein
MNEIVFRGTNDQALTNSLLVAKSFGKEHKHVLDSIRKLIEGCAEISADPMFEETTYVNEQNGQTYPMYLMNRDGFTLLVMDFKGKRAMQFKLEYIKAFNSMEAQIKASQKPKSQLEILQMSINQLVEQEHRLSSVERDVAEAKKEIAEMKQERVENGKLLLEAEVSENKVPEVSMRNKIRRLVNQYAAATNTSQRDIWRLVYDNLLYAYNIAITRYNRKKGQSYLDVAEEHGFLGKIFDIVSKVVNTNKDKM